MTTDLDLDEVVDTTGFSLEFDEGDYEPESESTAKPAGFPARAIGKRDLSRFLFVDIETIPDWDRIDAFGLDVPSKPKDRTPIEQCPDVTTTLDQAIGSIETDLVSIWPCAEWLVQVMDAEQKGKKREGVRKAVQSLISKMDSDQNAEAAFIKKLSLNPQYCKIASIGVASGEESAISIVNDERTGLEEFWSRAAISNPIVGFNSNAFDLPSILVRSMILGVKPTRKLDLRAWSDSCLDLMRVIFGNGPSIKFKTLARMYGLKVLDEEGEGSKVNQWMLDGEYEKVRFYNCSDVELTRDLYRKIEGYFV